MQSETALIISTLTTDKILSVTQSCHRFFVSGQNCAVAPVSRLLVYIIFKQLLKKHFKMYDTDLERQKQFFETIKKLRSDNFKKGLPFLMLSPTLPAGQSYLEFQDGHIDIQKVYIRHNNYFSKTVRTLGPIEANELLKEYWSL
jgi:hypothetical protein